MDFEDVVRRRRMVRRYDADRPVPRGLIDRLIDLASRAPSAGFTQGWHFVVLDGPAERAAFWAATADDTPAPDDAWLIGMKSAPCLVLALSDRSAYLDRYAEPDKGWVDRDPNRWPVPYWDIDTGMASLIILLAATDADLGSCFFGVPAERQDRVRSAFSVPLRMAIVGVVSLGYPKPGPASPSLRRGRRPVDSIRSFDRFQQVSGAAPVPLTSPRPTAGQ